MEVEATWQRTVKVWWSLAWRNLLAILTAMALSMIVGFIIGFMLVAVGVPRDTVPFVTGPIGFVIGVSASIVPVKLVLNKDYSEFRLSLISSQRPVAQS